MLVKDLTDLNADDVRQELCYFMQENPASIKDLSREMGMSHITLEAFLYKRKTRGPDLKTVLKVKKFLRDRYKERDDEHRAA